MEQQVAEGRFREDLYQRINVMSLELPPLRERREDITLLVQHFLGSDWRIEPAALAALEAYHWPGNVRQLINALERGKIMSDDKTIRTAGLPAEVAVPRRTPGAQPRQPAVGQELASVERAHIVEILQREKGNKVRTARALGVNRRSLYRLLDKYGIRAVAEAISAGNEQAKPFAHCE
jgi:DNA-binding NtrC family response regulator